MAGKRRGQPTQYSQAKVDEVCSYIEEGVPLKWAYRAAGIGHTTFYEWQEKHPEFAEAVEEARARAIANRVGRINKAAKEGTWQADAWYLERQDPDEFGRRQVIRHGGDETAGPVRVLVEYEDAVTLYDDDDGNAGANDADGASSGERSDQDPETA